MMLCKNHVGVTLGVLGGLFYIVCHFWGFVLPAEALGRGAASSRRG